MCVLASATRSLPATNAMVTRRVPHASASHSVCPGTLHPAIFQLSLWIGPVTIASIRPACAAAVASWRNRSDACPPSAVGRFSGAVRVAYSSKSATSTPLATRAASSCGKRNQNGLISTASAA